MEINKVFLSEIEKCLLVDGYCRKNRNNGKYIPIELCNIIILFYKNNFNCDFFIIFEKIDDSYFNELFCYDIKSKLKSSKIINYGTHS